MRRVGQPGAGIALVAWRRWRERESAGGRFVRRHRRPRRKTAVTPVPVKESLRPLRSSGRIVRAAGSGAFEAIAPGFSGRRRHCRAALPGSSRGGGKSVRVRRPRDWSPQGGLCQRLREIVLGARRREAARRPVFARKFVAPDRLRRSPRRRAPAEARAVGLFRHRPGRSEIGPMRNGRGLREGGCRAAMRESGSPAGAPIAVLLSFGPILTVRRDDGQQGLDLRGRRQLPRSGIGIPQRLVSNFGGRLRRDVALGASDTANGRQGCARHGPGCVADARLSLPGGACGGPRSIRPARRHETRGAEDDETDNRQYRGGGAAVRLRSARQRNRCRRPRIPPDSVPGAAMACEEGASGPASRSSSAAGRLSVEGGAPFPPCSSRSCRRSRISRNDSAIVPDSGRWRLISRDICASFRSDVGFDAFDIKKTGESDCSCPLLFKTIINTYS
jgi:hypothetical protein